jgi:hypothetical protein
VLVKIFLGLQKELAIGTLVPTGSYVQRMLEVDVMSEHITCCRERKRHMVKNTVDFNVLTAVPR